MAILQSVITLFRVAPSFQPRVSLIRQSPDLASSPCHYWLFRIIRRPRAREGGSPIYSRVICLAWFHSCATSLSWTIPCAPQAEAGRPGEGRKNSILTFLANQRACVCTVIFESDLPRLVMNRLRNGVAQVHEFASACPLSLGQAGQKMKSMHFSRILATQFPSMAT